MHFMAFTTRRYIDFQIDVLLYRTFKLCLVLVELFRWSIAALCTLTSRTDAPLKRDLGVLDLPLYDWGSFSVDVLSLSNVCFLLVDNLWRFRGVLCWVLTDRRRFLELLWCWLFVVYEKLLFLFLDAYIIASWTIILFLVPIDAAIHVHRECEFRFGQERHLQYRHCKKY